MQNISEILQTIARQRARNSEASAGKAADKDLQPTTLPIEGAPGERVAHLPIEADLAQAWVALTGEPFRPHQAHALTSLRRGEPVALRASSADVEMSAFLLLYATLLADRSASALVLAPDRVTLEAARVHLAQINQELPRTLNLATTIVEPGRRPDLFARVVIASPEAVHARLLRHHDRAWRLFWPRLRLVLIPEIQRYTGVAAAQMADLLFRTQRVATRAGQLINLLATLEDVSEVEHTIESLVGQPWRIVPADDGPRLPTSLAIWRAGSGRLRDATELAIAIQRNGYQVHLFCQPIDQALAAPIVADTPRITVGPDLGMSQVLVVAGYPGSHSLLRRMLRAGYQMVVLVLGDLPHEQALARRATTLLTDPAPAWATPTPNAYVLAKNALCAASEQPLTEAEVNAWGISDIVSRLVSQGQLVDLPDPEVAWKPTDAAGDPYEDWNLRSSVGGSVVARTERGYEVSQITPAIYERWAFPGAALPPGYGGFRVQGRDEDTGAITLRAENGARRTYPLRRCQVSVREVRETRVLPGSRPLGWGRVVVDEEIYGYRESGGPGAPADVALKPPLAARWTAPACWFDLPIALQVVGQVVGWSLAAALPLRLLAELTDVVPCYDHEARRLYLVDAQPGGSGLALWLYTHAEELLPLAYDVAYACRNDPLLEPLSRVDMDWLLALLGPQPQDEARQADEGPRTKDQEPTTDDRRPATGAEGRGPKEQGRRTDRQPATERRRPSADDRAPTIGDPPSMAGAGAVNGNGPASGPPGDRQPAEPAGGAPLAPTRPEPARSEPAEATGPPQEPQHVSSPASPAARPDDARSGPPDRSPAEAGASKDQQSMFGDMAPLPPKPARGRAKAAASSAPIPEEDEAPDPAALIARLRRQREQREAQTGGGRAAGAPSGASPHGPDRVERRFAAGDKIFCLPYGDGIVRASRVESGRELLAVSFPDFGELEIDPAVSLVRKIEGAAPEDDDLL